MGVFVAILGKKLDNSKVNSENAKRVDFSNNEEPKAFKSASRERIDSLPEFQQYKL